MVEHNLAKVGVASSSLVFRSKKSKVSVFAETFFVVILSLIAPPSTCGKVVLYQLAVIEVSQQVNVVLEVAGAEDTFRLAWECARPNAIVTVVALYDKPQILPLPEMYGKNLTFKTGGVDGCDCAEILSLIEAGKIDTTPLITHRYKLADIAEAYHLFENKLDGVIKVAVEP